MSLQDGAYVASMVSATSFVLSLLVALYQINRARHIQRYSAAAQLWDTYLGRSMEYPAFAYPPNFLSRFSYSERKFDGYPEEFERYEWFVSGFLQTADEILTEFAEGSQEGDHRTKMVLRNVRYHRSYLVWRKRQNIKDDYIDLLSPKLVKVISQVIAESV